MFMKTKIFVLAMLSVLIFISCVSLRSKYSKQVAIVENIMNDESYLGKIRNDTNYVNIESATFKFNQDSTYSESLQYLFERDFQIIKIRMLKHNYRPGDYSYSSYGDNKEGVMIRVKANKNDNKVNFHFLKFGDKYLLEFIELNYNTEF